MTQSIYSMLHRITAGHIIEILLSGLMFIAMKVNHVTHTQTHPRTRIVNNNDVLSDEGQRVE